VDDGTRRVWDSFWKHPHQELQVELGVAKLAEEFEEGGGLRPTWGGRNTR